MIKIEIIRLYSIYRNGIEIHVRGPKIGRSYN